MSGAPSENSARTAEASPPLSPSQLVRLAALGEEHRASVGDVLYREGDTSFPFIVILEGEVTLVLTPPRSPKPLALPQPLHGSRRPAR